MGVGAAKMIRRELEEAIDELLAEPSCVVGILMSFL